MIVENFCVMYNKPTTEKSFTIFYDMARCCWMEIHLSQIVMNAPMNVNLRVVERIYCAKTNTSREFLNYNFIYGLPDLYGWKACDRDPAYR